MTPNSIFDTILTVSSATAAASSTASNGIYRLVPNEQDRFAGRRIIWEELTQPERSRNETGFINLMRGNLPTCAQVKDERSMFRVCHTPDDLRDWFQHEKGLPQAGYRNLRGDPHYDRLPESILGNVTFALRLRHHIEGRKDIVTQADEAEDAFVTSVLDAYDTYTDTLEALGLYPVDRDGYKRTTEGEVRVSEANNETEDEAEPELAKPSKRKKSGKSKNSPGIGPSNAPGPEARHSSEEL